MIANSSRMLLLGLLLAAPAAAQRSEEGLNPIRAAVGGALVGFKPSGEFAENVSSAFGGTGHFLFRMDPKGILALRADLSVMVYGNERYRTALGGGPLGLITVDVNTTNSIVLGGLGLQLMAPGRTVRPYATATGGFSYFWTESSVEGIGSNEPFASTTNYDDSGFSWTAGGGLYVPVAAPRGQPLSLDLGVRWVDNGKRQYLREDGITFENNGVQLHPVESEAQGLQFTLGVSLALRF